MQRFEDARPDETTVPADSAWQPRDEGDALVQEIVADTARLTYDDLPNVKNSRLEEAAHRLATTIRARLENGTMTNGAITGWHDDLLDLCNDVEDAITLAQSAVLPVPKLLEVTGNVEEKELAARYMEQKEAGALFHARRSSSRLREQFEHAADMFRACASDFRASLHLPSVTIGGRVIPYNDTNDTGIRHEDTMRRFFDDVHARNVKAGWWTNLTTGEPARRSVGEMFVLMVTELAEAYKAWRASESDDKLPQHPGVGVEIGDLLIRVADFCGALAAGKVLSGDIVAWNPGDLMFQDIVEIAERYESIRKTELAVGDPETGEFLPPMDVAEMIDSKLAYNASREDHKIENRLKEDGKRT